MKQNKLFLGLATMFAAAFTFTACSSDDAETQSVQQDRTIRLTSSVERGSTRATSDPQSGTSLSTSSSLGVFAINNSTALDNGANEPYSVDGSGNLNPTTTANKMTWPASGNVSFYAYAPYAAGATYDSANSFSVQTDQTGAGYLASDLVVAKSENVAETSSAVELSFNHLMAKINITIQKATNATVDLKHAKVSIINTNTATTFKPNATGTGDDKVLGASSTPADITLFEGDGSTEPTTVVGIMVPQDIAAGSGLVKIQTYPGNAANRTLIAKVDEAEATTFASGQQYSFTVTINDPTAPVTYITLKAGSDNLVAWYDNNLGAATKEYSIGDYICSDGSVVKNADLASSEKTAIAVIFSNQVGAADAEWDGYAVSVSGPMTGKKWGGSTLIGTAITGSDNPTLLSNALADYSGLTTTTLVQAIEGYSTEYTAFDFSSYPDISGVTNLSGWFMPSFGQMVDLIQNLGEFSDIKTTIAGLTSTNNAQITTDLSFLSTINNHKPGSTDIITSGIYTTTSENSATNIWILNIGASDVQLSRQAGKTGNSNKSVLPIIAFKVK